MDSSLKRRPIVLLVSPTCTLATYLQKVLKVAVKVFSYLFLEDQMGSA